MRKLLIVLFLLLPVGFSKAQSAPTKPVEPTAIGVIYRLDNKKKNRRFLAEKLKSNLIVTEEIKGLPVEVSKYGESSYKLVSGSPLAPGEYAILIASEAYTFGIDQ